MPEDIPKEAAQSPDQPIQWYQKRWVQNVLVTAGTVLILYGMVCIDVVSRAKESYLEGEKYMRWHENPSEKKAELDAKFEKEKAGIDENLADNAIDQDEYDRQLEILEFDRERNMEESSIKYAYVWYQTVYELFSPPESRWVKASRKKAAVAKEMWKKELRSKNIPFEEYMLE